ncbi:MAG: excisionase family DNA-binding protein [Chloroflexi bacterium]|nr:excisionase family DNA-binding protein [Chloroflexota bacterium]
MRQLSKTKSVPVKFIAEYCLVSRTTVRRWIKDGRLLAVKLPGGHYRVKNEDFRAFLERYAIPVSRELLES